MCGIRLGSFLAAKITKRLSVNKLGVIEEYKTFGGLSDVKKCLDRKEFFNMLDSEDLFSKQPLSWKKSFKMGVLIPFKERKCGVCKKDLTCVRCDKINYQTKILTVLWNALNRVHPNEKGDMLSWSKDNFEY